MLRRERRGYVTHRRYHNVLEDYRYVYTELNIFGILHTITIIYFSVYSGLFPSAGHIPRRKTASSDVTRNSHGEFISKKGK